MFQPAMFREVRLPVLHGMMREHPFATLVMWRGGAPAADHLPMVLHADGTGPGVLHGHLAAGNPLVRGNAPEGDALVIFHGPQSYVSPSWYASKREHGKVVPTWNYVVVHARGRLRVVREDDWLLRHLDELTAGHETGRPEPWAVADAPEAFVRRQLRGLAGIQIELTAIEGTWKLSQNNSRADAQGVAEGLQTSAGSEGLQIAGMIAGGLRS